MAPQKKKLKRYVRNLFPTTYAQNSLPRYLLSAFEILNKKVSNDSPRILGNYGKDIYGVIIDKYSTLPERCNNPLKQYNQIVDDLFSGVPRWRNPKLQYNVGAPPNVAASAIYALSLDENIYNINDGLAGNALIAEWAVTKILSRLAKIETQVRGFFTFGGTATNLYAIKLGIKKAAPESSKKGVPCNIKILITEDSHFSHTTAADWLGIGINNVIVIKPNLDRSSNLLDAESKARQIITEGNLLATIIVNGGTTYNHTIDDIKAFMDLRDRLVKDFRLDYKPHIHVDSVIGWAWLFFIGYDFTKNNLGVDKETLASLHEQSYKISYLKYADSWGVDFHKGVGACPVPCSMIMINNVADLKLLSKKGDDFPNIHQLAPEFSFDSPADFTIETSRPGGSALAALVSLHTLGSYGYQKNLANLVRMSSMTKKLLRKHKDVVVCNPDSLGYVTMFRLYPPEFKNDTRRFCEDVLIRKDAKEFIQVTNNYVKKFFDWDQKTRMLKNRGVEYSFSSEFIKLQSGFKLSAAKLYNVSPHTNEKHIRSFVNTIINRKKSFDKNIWNKP